MQFKHLVVALLVLAVSAPLALAGDVVAMPTGNSVPAKTVQVNYIYWNTDAINTPVGKVRDFINIGEVFVGVTDRLEIDYLYAAPQGWDKVSDNSFVNEVNAYYTVVKEAPGRHPQLILGATNLTGADWLPSLQRPNPDGGDDRVSPFAVASYNIQTPNGAPNWDKPLVRAHLGFGTGWHDNAFFGGVQTMFTPKIGLAVFNYQRYPAYLVAYMPIPGMELNAGYDHGAPLAHVSYNLHW
ncbi:MAG TPA: hypothetical protein VGM19_01330 [Armatimonadota bacterium]|jgi:hypothetical protein